MRMPNNHHKCNCLQFCIDNLCSQYWCNHLCNRNVSLDITNIINITLSYIRLKWNKQRNINVSTGFYIIAQYGHSYDAIAQSILIERFIEAMHNIMSINLFRFFIALLIQIEFVYRLFKCQITSGRKEIERCTYTQNKKKRMPFDLWWKRIA